MECLIDLPPHLQYLQTNSKHISPRPDSARTCPCDECCFPRVYFHFFSANIAGNESRIERSRPERNLRELLVFVWSRLDSINYTYCRHKLPVARTCSRKVIVNRFPPPLIVCRTWSASPWRRPKETEKLARPNVCRDVKLFVYGRNFR